MRIIYSQDDFQIGEEVRHKGSEDKVFVITGIFFRGNPNGADFCQFEVEHISNGNISSQWASASSL